MVSDIPLLFGLMSSTVHQRVITGIKVQLLSVPSYAMRILLFVMPGVPLVFADVRTFHPFIWIGDTESRPDYSLAHQRLHRCANLACGLKVILRGRVDRAVPQHHRHGFDPCTRFDRDRRPCVAALVHGDVRQALPPAQRLYAPCNLGRLKSSDHTPLGSALLAPHSAQPIQGESG